MKSCIECGRTDGHFRRQRCKACWQRYRAHEIICGRWQSKYTDAQPVRNHVKVLRDAGLSMRQIAVLAGISRNTLQWLNANPTSSRMMATSAKAILAVPVPDVLHHVAADHELVSSIGTHRRIQALIAFGYSREHLAKQLGMSRGNIYGVLSQQYVTAMMACRVEKLFNTLQFTPGPSKYARYEGRHRGWPVPFEWDEDWLDSTEFEWEATEKEKPLTIKERYNELRYLGFSNRYIAERLTLKPYEVKRLSAEYEQKS